ncbi:MAG: glycosyltransferase family 4 protein [Chloroflexi bacterium]|nr:glycosyltransferase family 4 protein [Chloroflexota bacterium]
MSNERLRIFTWHIHGNYLWYLSQANCDFYIPYKPGPYEGYVGRGTSFPFGDNVHEIPADQVHEHEFDCVLFQTRKNYVQNQYEIFSDAQLALPSVYLEHDPPQEHPTDQMHWYDNPNGLLVHVTAFNALMWNSGQTPTRVIDHGVIIPPNVRYTGELARGIVVVNNLAFRGRRLGIDIFQHMREHVPLDLVGMAAEELGGLGVIANTELAAFESHYRFLFNPIRYTSLGLAVCEAMSIGMPIIGLATTEMTTAIENGVTGFVDTNLDTLIDRANDLLRDPHLARYLGERARLYALDRFNIHRFAREWEESFRWVTGIAKQRLYRAPLEIGESIWANESP